MLFKLRQRAKDERGFTLIELLVVILIIGILAAIAIPSFLNQKSKASDAAAKELAHTAQVAEETCATDNNGAYYPNCNSASTLVSYESTIQTTSGSNNAYLSAVTAPSGGGYTVTTTSTTGDTFSITRSSGGSLSRSCGAPGGASEPAGTVVGGCVFTTAGTSGTW
jgi:type IV pilus assembly protein PilA